MSRVKKPNKSSGAQGMLVFLPCASGGISAVALASKKGQLSFLKGGIEKMDATLRHTAAREKSEESQIPDDEVRVLPNHLFRELSIKGNPSVTCWAALYIGPIDRQLCPRNGDAITDCRWYPLDEAIAHPGLQPARRAVLKDAIRIMTDPATTALLVPCADWLTMELPEDAMILHVQEQPASLQSQNDTAEALSSQNSVAPADILPMNTACEEKYSRFLSKVLRHKFAQYGLEMHSDGTVSVDALLRLRDLQGLTHEGLRWVVTHNAKQRFSFDASGHRIRANQGHNQRVGQVINDDELLTEMHEPLPCCVHGTYRKAEKLIRAQGLKCMKRDWIHFAPGLPSDSSVISGMRSNAEVLIYIDMAKAMTDGIKFYQARNGVIQTRGIERVLSPAYFAQTLFL